MLEWVPSKSKLSTFSTEQVCQALPKQTVKSNEALQRAFSLFSFYGSGKKLTLDDLKNAIRSITDNKSKETEAGALMDSYGVLKDQQKVLSYGDFKKILESGILHEQEFGRYFVCLSLAEAETIRRIIHVKDALGEELVENADMEVALRFNPANDYTKSNSPLCGDGGLIIDASKNWQTKTGVNTGASLFQKSLSQN